MLWVKGDEGLIGNSVPGRRNSMHTASKIGGSVIQLRNWKKEDVCVWDSERRM